MSQMKKIHKWVQRLQDILSEDRHKGREQVEALEKALRKLRKRESELVESLNQDVDRDERRVLKDRLKLVRRHIEKGDERLKALRSRRDDN